MSVVRASVFVAVVSVVGGLAQSQDQGAQVQASAKDPKFTAYYEEDVESSLAVETNFAPIVDANDGASDKTACTCTDCAGDIGCCCCCPLWSVQVGAVILGRGSRSTVLLEDTISGEPLANLNQLGDAWSGGPDIAVKRWLDCGRSIDVRFFAVNSLDSSTTLTTSPIWNFPTEPPLFGLGVADITLSYSTRLYSTEINWNSPINDYISWLAGFRWVEQYENLNFAADFGGNQAQIGFQTANRLYGAQLGANITLFCRDALRVESVLKAGIYGNASSHQFAVQQAIGPAFTASDRIGQVAFLGEIGVVGVYQWTDCVALRAGYQLLWLDGIALAPDQIAATQVLTADGIDAKGDAFYHGALLGVDIAW